MLSNIGVSDMSIFQFADTIDKLFRKTRGSEIVLFDKLCDYLATTSIKSHSINTAKYHGTGHMVEFDGDGIYANLPKERCELADIMIIVNSSTDNFSKMVLIQAKKDKKLFSLKSCHLRTYWGLETHQWFLLSTRPRIKGVGGFSFVPHDLLSSARFPSIASYLIFYEDSSLEMQMFYAPASNLINVNSIGAYNPKSKKRNFSLINSINCNMVGSERQSACYTTRFIRSLLQGEIGEDIALNTPTFNLVSQVVNASIQSGQGNIALATQIKNQLNLPDSERVEVPFKTVLMINIESK